jgi:hypothetical protein
MVINITIPEYFKLQYLLEAEEKVLRAVMSESTARGPHPILDQELKTVTGLLAKLHAVLDKQREAL